MISIPFIVCILGLICWLIFAKTKLSDPWIAEVGRICFIVGLFWALSTYAGKVVF